MTIEVSERVRLAMEKMKNEPAPPEAVELPKPEPKTTPAEWGAKWAEKHGPYIDPEPAEPVDEGDQNRVVEFRLRNGQVRRIMYHQAKQWAQRGLGQIQ